MWAFMALVIVLLAVLVFRRQSEDHVLALFPRARFPGWTFPADQGARLAVMRAESRLGRSTPMGSSVASTPSGNWVGVYFQYGRMHPIPAQELRCLPPGSYSSTGMPHGQVFGSGFDDVGQFFVQGAYDGARFSLAKRYVPGTGNPRENLGHTVGLRLTYCVLSEVIPEQMGHLRPHGLQDGVVGLYGVWHVRTPHYNGDAEMCLWLPPTPVAQGYLILPQDGVVADYPVAVATPVASASPPVFDHYVAPSFVPEGERP